MREVLLVRHGAAVSDAPGGDAARPLNAAGRDEIARVARALRVFGFKPDHMWHSPYVRAAQTAQILAPELAPAVVEPHVAFTPDDDAVAAAALVGEARCHCLLIVSHMPLLPSLLAELTGARAEFGTGTVAHLRVFAPRAAALLGLWTAEQLASVLPPVVTR